MRPAPTPGRLAGHQQLAPFGQQMSQAESLCKQHRDNVGAAHAGLGRDVVEGGNELGGDADREGRGLVRSARGSSGSDVVEVELRIPVLNEVGSSCCLSKEVRDRSADRQTTSPRVRGESVDDGLRRVETDLGPFAEMWLSHGSH